MVSQGIPGGNPNPGPFLFGPSREEPTPTSGRMVMIADSDLIYVRFGPLLRAQGGYFPRSEI
jgi:hypothetical protein